jgi:hypothetical protein
MPRRRVIPREDFRRDVLEEPPLLQEPANNVESVAIGQKLLFGPPAGVRFVKRF